MQKKTEKVAIFRNPCLIKDCSEGDEYNYGILEDLDNHEDWKKKTIILTFVSNIAEYMAQYWTLAMNTKM